MSIQQAMLLIPYCFFQGFAINCLKVRHSNSFLLWNYITSQLSETSGGQRDLQISCQISFINNTLVFSLRPILTETDLLNILSLSTLRLLIKRLYTNRADILTYSQPLHHEQMSLSNKELHGFELFNFEKYNFLWTFFIISEKLKDKFNEQKYILTHISFFSSKWWKLYDCNWQFNCHLK